MTFRTHTWAIRHMPAGNIYTDLPNVRSIRLVRIKPAISLRNVVCSLETVSLDSASLVYDALSYTWGDGQKKKPIICNGQKVQVTNRLHYIFTDLRSLRRKQGSEADIYIWIDQLCINQTFLKGTHKYP
ncbi:hypothetical protein GQ44DRAFT_809739 [Phaeosphaeriaceae sp. PMI808]|nr:hypothetical protein GQ44DRAFT_809739 [Phaeosphaeriaceae sp. PMI808]